MAETIVGKAIDIIAHLMNADKNILWDLSEHKDKKKRSLSSNRYYWNLLEELALKTHVPKMKIHNLYLRQVGQTVRIGDRPIFMLLLDNDDTENQVLLASTYHLAPRKETKVGSDGRTYRWYVMLKGSSDFCTEEMNMLVDLAVQDAKAQGIETMTPEELAHIRELEKQNEQKNQTSIVTSDMRHCYIHKKYLGVEIPADHIHHCLHGVANRKLADEDKLLAPLCSACHTKLHDCGFHDLDLQKDAEIAWLKVYNKTVDDFIKRYGKNYL